MECVWTEETVRAHIEEQYNKFRSVCRDLYRGLLSEADVHQKFEDVFYNGFSKYIKDKGFRLSMNAAGWTRFAEDCRLWENGELPASTSGKAWLLYENREAMPLDRRFFFELMAAFNVSVQYYEPLRDGAYHDDYMPGRFPGEMIIGNNIWKDDEGLLSDDLRPGSTIELTDHYGLRSVILINEFIPRKEFNGAIRHCEYYKGHGSIEGYTKPAGSYMELCLCDGKLSYIDFYPDTEDWNAHNSFPLWKEQIEHEEQRRKIYDSAINGLIRRFILHNPDRS